ncbi:hypothetical protein AGIG_G4869 [Arapaima gigas]
MHESGVKKPPVLSGLRGRAGGRVSARARAQPSRSRSGRQGSSASQSVTNTPPPCSALLRNRKHGGQTLSPHKKTHRTTTKRRHPAAPDALPLSVGGHLEGRSFGAAPLLPGGPAVSVERSGLHH